MIAILLIFNQYGVTYEIPNIYYNDNIIYSKSKTIKTNDIGTINGVSYINNLNQLYINIKKIYPNNNNNQILYQKIKLIIVIRKI